MKQRLRTSTWLLLSIALSASAAGDLYDVPKVTTVQNRLYHLHNEVTLQGSYLPLDPYSKYIGAGLSYTTHFSSFTSWEVFNANYVFAIPGSLKANLNTLGRPASDPRAGEDYSDRFFTMQYYASSNLKFTPLYIKNLLFNSSIVYSMISFVGGGGVAGFQRDDKVEARIRPFINVGIIIHYMLSPKTLLKFDFRDQIFTASDTKNNMSLTLGFALNFGGGASAEEQTIDDEF